MQNTEQIQNEIKQVDAIFALEGFLPNKLIQSIDKSVLSGIGSYEESVKELIDYVHINKTSVGFIYSKTLNE